MSGEEKDKKLKIKSPKSRRSKEIDVATKSESFLTKTIGVPKKLQYYSRSGRSSSEIGREKKMKQSLPSPRKKAELELEITKPDSSGDDASPSDSDSDSEEIIESPKPVIGKNVVNAAIPNRKPPAPPKDEAPDNPIRVAGVVSPSMPKNSEASQNTPKGWITRTDIPDTGEQTQFVHSNTIFNQIDDASHRTKLVREVVSSEESYVDSLNTLVHHYLNPLRNHTDKRVTKDLATIFGNVEQILQLNLDFLAKLQERTKKWDDNDSLIGDIFTLFAPFLKLYASYGTNYEGAITLYQKEMKENMAFKDAVELRNLEAGSSVHLHHLLIMPIQRIPRYNMLLTDILKHTEPTHPDYANLQEALSSTQKVAIHLNESVRESEMEQKLSDLAERLEITLLLAPHRRLLREGTFRIIVGKKEKRNLHHIILFNDILVCISRSKIKKPSEFTNSRNNYPLSLVWFNEAKVHQEKLKCLNVINPSYSFGIIFETQEELLAWNQVLTFSISSCLESQPKVEQDDSNTDEGNLPAKRYGCFVYPDGTSYTGWFVNGQKQGHGEFSFGFNHYSGNFEQNKMSGEGKITYTSGDMYVGQWENGLQNGNGTFGTPTGDVYEGAWVDGRKQGQGKYVYSNGDCYSGQWACDLQHGVGRFTYASGKRYNGEWIKGQRSGVGTMDYGNGSNYEGEWLLDKPHGRGLLVLPDGSYYDGEFAHGAYEGTGVMVYKDGRKYSGQWKAGKPNGSGTYTSVVGSVSLLEGEWVNGCLQGKGSLNFSNGDTFSGFFRDNWLHGIGSFTHGNIVTEGRWNMGQLEGKVTIKIEDKENNSISITGMALNGISVHTNNEYSPPLPLSNIPSYIHIDL